ncbi:MAG: RNA-processing protein [Methanobacteriota archaeon]
MGSPLIADSDMERDIKRYWFGDLVDECWLPADKDPDSLLERMRQHHLVMCSRPSWKEAVLCGFCRDQDEYLSILRDLGVRWSQDTVQRYNSSDEARLIKLVLILRETDLMISRVSEQLTAWQDMIRGDIHAGSSVVMRIESDSLKSDRGDDSISLLSHDLVRMRGSRSRLAQDIAKRCEKILPNCCELVGPLVAARLVSAAGGLNRLARMPASAIQILGAKNAFFSHRSTGSPPPKHGLIFEHKRVHTAPRRVRGRVARTIAANLAIASRIDCYRGLIDLEFLEKAEIRIEKAGQRS